jgi:GR25 family glycosyltransferase involved in LPS biosynthesis
MTTLISGFAVSVVLIQEEGDEEALKDSKQKLEAEGINFSVKKALSTTCVDSEDVKSLIEEGTVSPVANFNISELCWFITHYGIWKRFVEDKTADLLLVFDDTVIIKPDFKRNLEAVLVKINEIHEPWNVLYLYHSNFLDYKIEKKLQVSDKISLYKIHGFSFPSVCSYVLTRKFAANLLLSLPVKESVEITIGRNQNWDNRTVYLLNMFPKDKESTKNHLTSHESHMIDVKQRKQTRHFSPQVSSVALLFLKTKV